MNKILALLIATLLSFQAFAKPIYLFCLQNLGETNAMIPVLEKLPKKDYKILALGKAAEKLKEHPCMITSKKARLHPKVVVSGMASAEQAEILNQYPDAFTIAYYDNFDPIVSEDGTIKEYIRPFHKALKKVKSVIVPGMVHIDGAKKLSKFSESEIKALGQPSLEGWNKLYAETDTSLLRKKLGVRSGESVIVYAGGFDPVDEEQYKKDLTAFVQASSMLKDTKVFITYHPKTDGKIERDIVKEFGSANVRVVLKEEKLSTATLSTIADAIACFKSTIGAQAAYMGKPVLYVASHYTNFLINYGVALQASTIPEIKEVLENMLHGKGKKSPSFQEALGIPKNASDKIAQYLIGLKRN